MNKESPILRMNAATARKNFLRAKSVGACQGKTYVLKYRRFIKIRKGDKNAKYKVSNKKS